MDMHLEKAKTELRNQGSSGSYLIKADPNDPTALLMIPAFEAALKTRALTCDTIIETTITDVGVAVSWRPAFERK